MDTTLRIDLPSDNPSDNPRECRMSLDFYQNARLTMGELRDLVRAGVFSWEFLEYHIRKAQCPRSPLDKTLDKLDDYTTGLGKSLHDKPSNVW